MVPIRLQSNCSEEVELIASQHIRVVAFAVIGTFLSKEGGGPYRPLFTGSDVDLSFPCMEMYRERPSLIPGSEHAREHEMNQSTQ